jgi:hypothetical protein
MMCLPSRSRSALTSVRNGRGLTFELPSSERRVEQHHERETAGQADAEQSPDRLYGAGCIVVAVAGCGIIFRSSAAEDRRMMW